MCKTKTIETGGIDVFEGGRMVGYLTISGSVLDGRGETRVFGFCSIRPLSGMRQSCLPKPKRQAQEVLQRYLQVRMEK
jgi:hypothetical protein